MILKPIKTGDGSFTIFSQKYNEHYHSLRDGALNETLYKHIIPAFSHFDFSKKKSINVLDICFGIGLNTLATIYYAQMQKLDIEINIYSPEIDSELLDSLKTLQYSQEFIPFLDLVYEISNNRFYKKNKIKVEVFEGDARDFVKDKKNLFDIIYQDPFSFKKNKELWSFDFFKDLYLSLDDNGILTTYSQSKVVRQTMKESKFCLYQHPFKKESLIRPGTLGFKTNNEILKKYEV